MIIRYLRCQTLFLFTFLCLLFFFPFLLLTFSLHLSISLCRELNEINRKHIQDSVALIRGVSTHLQAHTLLSPAVLENVRLSTLQDIFLQLSSTSLHSSHTLSYFPFLPYLPIFLPPNPMLPSFLPSSLYFLSVLNSPSYMSLF